MKTTQQLIEKYQITKPGLLKRVEFLAIQPEIGSRGAFFFTESHEQVLDDLHSHLQSGKAMESFIQLTPSEIVPSVKNAVSPSNGDTLAVRDSQVDSQLSSSAPFQIDLAPDCINKEVNDWFNLNQRLKYYWILEGLSQTDWGLTKDEIKELTDCKVTGDRYEYDCFVFMKSAKVKGKATWQVRKKGS